MVIYVDIDETICSTDASRDYSLSSPIQENINKINRLYSAGHTIVYWTARGSTTGIDWTDVTQAQLKKWGVKYHDLKLKKPNYDLFICDKAINSEAFFSQGDLWKMS
tara:strand:- start:130 stop:450 length:321 start_codon:yes stop_codon:yes gene_type:complete